MNVRLRATCLSGPAGACAGAVAAPAAAGEPAGVPAPGLPAAGAALVAAVVAAAVAPAVVGVVVLPATAWRVAFAFWLVPPQAASTSAAPAPVTPARNCRREITLEPSMRASLLTASPRHRDPGQPIRVSRAGAPSPPVGAARGRKTWLISPSGSAGASR